MIKSSIYKTCGIDVFRLDVRARYFNTSIRKPAWDDIEVIVDGKKLGRLMFSRCWSKEYIRLTTKWCESFDFYPLAILQENRIRSHIIMRYNGIIGRSAWQEFVMLFPDVKEINENFEKLIESNVRYRELKGAHLENTSLESFPDYLIIAHKQQSYIYIVDNEKYPDSSEYISATKSEMACIFLYALAWRLKHSKNS